MRSSRCRLAEDAPTCRYDIVSIMTSRGGVDLTKTGPAVLGGLRVVDSCATPAGVRATAVLADYGADVVWLEPPGGSSLRKSFPEVRSVFCRSKRSLTCDLTTSAGREALLELLRDADVFIEDGGSGVANSAGYGFDTVHELYPSLVYCSLTGFGRDGPHQHTPAHEALVHAVVGTMGEQVGFRDGPIYGNLPFASIGAGYLAQIGVLAALNQRRSDGAGRLVETSILDGALAYLSMMWLDSDEDHAATQPGTGRGRLVVRSFRCADGEYLGVHTGAAGAFGRLIEVLGLSEAIPPTTKGMDVGVALTAQEHEIIEHELPKIFVAEERSVWIERLLKADVCAIPVLHPCEVFDEPQTRHNGMVIEVDDTEYGRIEQVAPALRFGTSPGGPVTSAAVRERPDPRRIPTLGRATSGEPARESQPILAGLRILDFGVWYASAYASRLLADLGADVIKVEPVQGDQIRGLRPPFMSAHARKRSLAIDLKQPKVRPVVEELLRRTDIVHHNMRPGVAERLGIGYEQARSLNPGVIYVYGPGWGSSGPDFERQSFAPLVSGYVGASYEVAGQFNPPAYPVGNEDPGSGMLAAIAMLMARWRGNGEYIELPQVNAAMTHMAHIVRSASGEVIGAGRLDPLQRRIGPFDGLYETADSWICVVAVSDQEIRRLGRLLGVAVPSGNARSHPDAASEHELSTRLEEAFAQATTAEWLGRLGEAAVGAAEPIAVNNSRNFLRDVDNLRTGRVAQAPDRELGQVRQVDGLIRISDSNPAPFRPAPPLGGHTREILESVGLSESEIADLQRRGSIALGDLEGS